MFTIRIIVRSSALRAQASVAYQEWLQRVRGRRPDIRKSQSYIASVPLCPPHFKEFLKRLILAKCSGLRPLDVRSSSNGPKLGRLTVFKRTTSMPKYTSNVLCCFEVRVGSLTGVVGPDYMSMLLRANFEFNCFLDSKVLRNVLPWNSVLPFSLTRSSIVLAFVEALTFCAFLNSFECFSIRVTPLT
jgi:hypothetical protein